jgi:thiol-disulfide isomerase/thioredoxin
MEKNSTGRIVLAELFTGAECGPCVAADHAFDKLAEYYPRSELVILEYHEHIPGPDPLTNPDSYKRYAYYGGDFGTPTVFIDGKEKIIGGGNDIVTPNRFGVYDYLISKHAKKKSQAFISGTATRNSKDIVNITLNLQPATILDISSKGVDTEPYSLQIALVEKSVNYTGANGVSKHLFVVRDIVDNFAGKVIKRNKKSVSYSASVNLSDVRKGISDYLDDPTKDGSWRGGSFGGWKERTDKIDPANLAIVAWVQDTLTNEVLQSFYVDVAGDVSVK